MLYFELGLGAEDYLTERESRLPIRIRKIWWDIKARIGILVKKKVADKTVYVLPKVNKKFLKKVDKILKISGDKQICISDELYWDKTFLEQQIEIYSPKYFLFQNNKKPALIKELVSYFIFYLSYQS